MSKTSEILRSGLASNERMRKAADALDAMEQALRNAVANITYDTPAGTTNCRFCDCNMDHEGTHKNMHADDCEVRDISAALAKLEADNG